jgi:hypothetical protein
VFVPPKWHRVLIFFSLDYGNEADFTAKSFYSVSFLDLLLPALADASAYAAPLLRSVSSHCVRICLRSRRIGQVGWCRFVD